MKKNILLTWDAYNNGFVVTANAILLLKEKHIDINEVIYLSHKELSDINKTEMNIFLGKIRPKEFIESENADRYKQCYKIKQSIDNKPTIKNTKVKINNVTNYQEIYDKLIKIIKNEFNDSKNYNLHINVSPGTPQMHVVWLMLNASGYLPLNTKLWSTQFEKETKRTTLSEINFKPKTFLSETLASKYKSKYKIKINPNDTKSTKRKEAERLINLFSYIPNAPILLIGEKGTGKSTYVRNIIKKDYYPYHELISGMYSEELMRAELFGYKKGSFTGATTDKKGILDSFSNGGVLFLDEIQDLSKRLQRQLLQVIQTGEYYPIGATKSKMVNFKLVTATNKTIDELLDNRLDADFFDRISRFIVNIPPLRECKEDYQLNWEKAWKEIATFENAPALIWNTNVSKFLNNNQLKGNFRDLQKVISYIIAFKLEGHSESKSVTMAIKYFENCALLYNNPSINNNTYFNEGETEKKIVAKFRKDLVLWAKAKYGSIKKASIILGRAESTLFQDLRG